MEEDKSVEDPNIIKEGYIPENGLGKILSDPEIRELPILPIAKFFPKTGDPVVRYNLYNVMASSVHFTDGHVDGPCILLFSAFVKDIATISINDCISYQIQVPEISEKIKIRVRNVRKTKRYVMASPTDPSGKEQEFVLDVQQKILMDPMTNTLLDGCDVLFVFSKETFYRVSHVIIQEDIQKIEAETTVQRRKKAIMKTNAFFKNDRDLSSQGKNVEFEEALKRLELDSNVPGEISTEQNTKETEIKPEPE
jgi:hypothetical protein